MEYPSDINIVCFGGEDWWYHNRAHIDMQLMRQFAKKNTSLYVNSIVMQKPNLKEGGRFGKRLLRKLKSIKTGLKKSDAGFWVYSPFTMPVHHLAWARPLNKKILEYQIRSVSHKLGIKKPVVLVACPAACEVALSMEKTRLIYQRTDRFEEYPNVDNETIKRYDRQLKANADLTIFVSSSLFNEESKECKNAIFLDHGVDFDLFASAETIEQKPTEMQDMKKPVVGFFGDIEDHLLDFALIQKIVDSLPEMNFVFIGTVMSDCSKWNSRENVWLLGKKPYEQIPHYGKCFDVAIMPWVQTRWIDVCNPIKLKEYLALGKPVVSTPFAELQKYHDVVYEAKTADDFVSSIKKALSEDNPELIKKRRERIKNATWSSKAEMVLDELFADNLSPL